MLNRKKRILWVNEGSFLSTGYATYGKEVIGRLVKTGKYDIAELSSFTTINDPRNNDVPWVVYPNNVDKEDPRFADSQQRKNTFGEWRFERVLLDFKPDVVIDIRDPWMCGYQFYSPYRPFFHHCIMPTVDSSPQRQEWIESFMSADNVFTYSDWGLKVLDKQSRGNMKLNQSAYPGVDLQVFCPPTNKAAHKQSMGLEEDSIIIGTVMRNQKRKLYPDLLAVFKKLLESLPEDIAKKTYLYIHTGYPDLGWNLPELIKESGIGNKVLFTYICGETNKPFIGPMQDARTYSPYSHNASGVLPSVNRGVSPEQLADIYKCFDLYIQYAICEGFGMPQVEAAACGVPVASVDYSAMVDVLNRTNGIRLKVQKLFKELETNANRAMPDNDYCCSALGKYIRSSQEHKDKKSKQARAATEKYFNWDRTAGIWEEYLDKIVLTGLQGQWHAPYRHHVIPELTQEIATKPVQEYVEWLFVHVLNQPERAHSLAALEMIQWLNYGGQPQGDQNNPMQGLKPFTREDAYNVMSAGAKNFITCEECRTGKRETPMQDFVEYAHHKKKLLEQNEQHC